MNSRLLDSIFKQLQKAVSGTTKEIHFMYLPDQALLKKVTVTYEVQNTDNTDCFDSQEAMKLYSLRVNINAPTAKQLGNLSIYIKQFIYQLKSLYSTINYIKLKGEELFFDNELNIYTEHLNFEIQCS